MRQAAVMAKAMAMAAVAEQDPWVVTAEAAGLDRGRTMALLAAVVRQAPEAREVAAEGAVAVVTAVAAAAAVLVPMATMTDVEAARREMQQ